MQAAGKAALSLVTSLCGRRSVVKLVKPPAGLPGILLNSLHQDSHSPLTGPARNGHYKPTGQKGLSPADMGLLVGGVTIVGLGLYETYQSLCTALPNTGGDIIAPEHDQAVPSPAGVCHRTAAVPSPAGVCHRTAAVPSPAGVCHRTAAVPSPDGVCHRTAAVPSLAGVCHRTAAIPSLLETPEDTSGGSMSMSPTTPAADEVPVAATNDLVESKKNPKRSARYKGGILYSSIDELESENMSAAVPQYDLVVEKPTSPFHAGDLHATITEENHHEEDHHEENHHEENHHEENHHEENHHEENHHEENHHEENHHEENHHEENHHEENHHEENNHEENHHEEYQSTMKAPDFLTSPPVDTRGHVCREAEDMGDGAYKGGAGYLVDGDDGRKTAGVHDGSGDHAAGVVNKESSCHKCSSQYNSHATDGSCRHHEEATAPEKKQHRHAVALAEIQEDDVIHTTCATEFRDDSDCECDLAGSTVPSSVSMMGQARDNKMGSSHVVIIVS